MGDATERKYHVAHNNRKFGPLSLVELSSRRLSHDMLVWCEGMPSWLPIGEVPELRPYVQHAAPTRTALPPSRPGGAGPAPFVPTLEPQAGGMSGSWTAAPATPRPPVGGGGRLKFLAITTIVLGSLGLVCCPFSILGTVVEQPAFLAAVTDVETVVFGRVAIYGTMLLVSIPMLAGGIGLLKAKRWAAVTIMVASIICLVAYLAGFAFECGFVQLPLINAAAEENADELMAGTLVGVVLNAISMVAGLTWHATSLILVNSAPVRSRLQ